MSLVAPILSLIKWFFAVFCAWEGVKFFAEKLGFKTASKTSGK
jgi:hypothetical protein